VSANNPPVANDKHTPTAALANQIPLHEQVAYMERECHYHLAHNRLGEQLMAEAITANLRSVDALLRHRDELRAQCATLLANADELRGIASVMSHQLDLPIPGTEFEDGKPRIHVHAKDALALIEFINAAISIMAAP